MSFDVQKALETEKAVTRRGVNVSRLRKIMMPEGRMLKGVIEGNADMSVWRMDGEYYGGGERLPELDLVSPDTREETFWREFDEELLRHENQPITEDGSIQLRGSGRLPMIVIDGGLTLYRSGEFTSRKPEFSERVARRVLTILVAKRERRERQEANKIRVVLDDLMIETDVACQILDVIKRLHQPLDACEKS